MPSPPATSRNADLVRAALLASNGGDTEAFLACLAADVEWHSAGLFLHPAQAWHGREALRRGMEQRVQHFGDHPQVTLTELDCTDTLVLVVGTVAMPSVTQPVLLPGAWIFEVADGCIVWAQAYTNERRARTKWARRTSATA